MFGKKFCTERGVKYGKGLPWEVVELSSLGMFEERVALALGAVVWLMQQCSVKGWT